MPGGGRLGYQGGVFEAYVEASALPAILSEGQVVVVDNLAAHKGERVKDLTERRGCELLYLPPYWPDFNPIEEAFAKTEGLLRKAGARRRETLVEAMGVGRSRRYRREMLMASSSIAGTACRFNRYDECCRSSGPFYACGFREDVRTGNRVSGKAPYRLLGE